MKLASCETYQEKIFRRHIERHIRNMAGGNQKKKEAIIRKEIEQVADLLKRLKMK